MKNDSNISRRSLVHAAWVAPVVVLATSTPALAASPQSVGIIYIETPTSPYSGTYPVTVQGVGAPDNGVPFRSAVFIELSNADFAAPSHAEIDEFYRFTFPVVAVNPGSTATLTVRGPHAGWNTVTIDLVS